MNDLTNIIIQCIKDQGPISFRDFMEMALYHPKFGYYVSPGERIGKNGDYYTSPSISPVFGEMLSKQILEMWQLMGKKKFTIVEYGAGSGILCRDILDSLRCHTDLYDGLEYFIIEKKFPASEDQNIFLGPKVKWLAAHDTISNISGCILSNELIDNFSVHAVVMEDELMEVFVDHDGNSFYELLKPATTELKNYFIRLSINLPRGFRTEVNFLAIQWLGKIAAVLDKGFVMTIDYGYSSEELYTRQKKCGSVLCYHHHQVNNEPLHRIGDQDITADVNFSALKLWGNENNLRCCGYTSQSNFLRSFGIMKILRELESQSNVDLQQLIKIKTLVFDMGQKIKLMVHQKGLEKMFLTGLQFQLPV